MNDDNGPRIPIPGVAGATVFAALRGLAMHAGDGEVTIRKRRAAGGGYIYQIIKPQPPAEPVRSTP